MTNTRQFRLGTRGSALARWQADWVAAQLRAAGLDIEIVLITTQGDVATGPLGAAGGIGLFTKEIQRALLDERVDFAVHSLKDLPTEPVPGLSLAAVPPRERVGDALISNQYRSLDELPERARVGTGSSRRRSQLLHRRPDLEVLDIRGNVDTRLKKLDSGDYDAILLAEAGLKRLGFDDRIATVLGPPIMYPAVGQGALGIEARDSDEEMKRELARLDDQSTRGAVLAERAMLRELRGGCLAPVGAWGRVESDILILDGTVLSPDGKQRIEARGEGPVSDAEAIGKQVGSQLLDLGAAKLIGRG